ncbi:MAG: ammonium transporter [Planctomycetaceae bacterium]|jgi:Amt family ammonium transporter|nr:ammonium transporter [Planctomycetaceae bacterium]
MSFDLIPIFFAEVDVLPTSVVAGKFVSVDTIWVLLGTALVFFMHAGFTMVEAGFTRAKNTGNIAMKNILTFSLGTLFFTLIGFGIMFAPGIDISSEVVSSYWGGIDLFSAGAIANVYGSGTYPGVAFLIFQTVFCATSATIVSGAMAERTKFGTYCIYCILLSALIYPVSGHWVWGGGWLSGGGWLANSDLAVKGGWFSTGGFHDFAGSTVVHTVGGLSALIGAAFLGARVGKYTKDGKPRAILGSNIALGCLGVLILWFGWFGFNGCSTVCATGDETLTSMGRIFVTTNLAAAAGATFTMLITLLRYGKPDVSMTLNGALGGLVGITAGCDVVSPFGAVVIGLFTSIVLVITIEFIDKVLHIDDPVGAIAVHGVCGIVGTLSVGLLAHPALVGVEVVGTSTGLFYGGGFSLLNTQFVGVISVALWVIVTMMIIFKVLKVTVGLRVPVVDEIEGLDISEHGLASAYADFNITDQLHGIVAHEEGKVPISQAITIESPPVNLVSAKPVVDPNRVKFTKVEIICRQNKFDDLKAALSSIEITGMTVSQVMGCGMQRGGSEYYRGVQVDIQLLPKVCVDVVVCKIPVDLVIETAKKILYTGNIGDGKIFVYDVENVVKVRTGETGYKALQDE